MPPAEDEPSGSSPYRWTCPVCGESRVGIAGPDEHRSSKAIESLKTHIRVREGGGHGLQGSVPAGLADEDLAEHVETPGG